MTQEWKLRRTRSSNRQEQNGGADPHPMNRRVLRFGTSNAETVGVHVSRVHSLKSSTRGRRGRSLKPRGEGEFTKLNKRKIQSRNDRVSDKAWTILEMKLEKVIKEGKKKA